MGRCKKKQSREQELLIETKNISAEIKISMEWLEDNIKEICQEKTKIKTMNNTIKYISSLENVVYNKGTEKTESRNI